VPKTLRTLLVLSLDGLLPIIVLWRGFPVRFPTTKGNIMWLPVALSIVGLVLIALAARILSSRGSSAAWIDVGSVSGGWLAEHRSSKSNPSSV
jgi:hypothetical protein